MPLVRDFLAGRSPPDLYHQYLGPAFTPWAEALLKKLPPSDHVLDLACGTGLVSRRISQSSNVARVEAVDVAAPMVEKARALASSEGAATSYTTASAQELPFHDATFDVAYCQQGLQFFPDRAASLNEAHRVLKPGARIAYATWTSAHDGNPLFAALEDIVAREIGDDLVPFGPFAFGDRAAIEALVAESPFMLQSLDVESHPSPMPDARTLTLFDINFVGRPAPDGNLQPVLDFDDPASDAVIARIVEQMEEATTPYRQDDGSLLAPMKAHIYVLEA